MGKTATGTLTMVTPTKLPKCCKKTQWILISELVKKANLTATSVAPVISTGGKLNLMCQSCKKKVSVNYGSTRERNEILRVNNVMIIKHN